MIKLPLVLLLLLSSSLFAQEPIVSQDPVTDDSSAIPLVAPENLTDQSPHIELPPAIKVPISIDEESTSGQSEFVPPQGYSAQTGTQYGFQVKEHTVSMVTGEYMPKPGIEPSLQTAIALGQVEYALIQIDQESQVSEELFGRIHSLGVETYGELPGLAWQAKIPANVVFDLINMPEVRWIGHLPVKFKLDPSMFDHKKDDIINATVSIMGDDWVNGQETVAFSISADAGIDTPEDPIEYTTYLTNGPFQKILEESGLEPIVYHENSRSFKVSGQASAILSLAKLPIVSYITHAGDDQLFHAETVSMMSHDYIRDSWDGTDAHLGIIDSEVMMADGNEHDDLDVWYVTWDNTGQGAGANPSGHGTHVAGTMIGRGVGDSRFKGMAPGAGNSATSRFFHGRYFNSSGSAIGDRNNLYDALMNDFTDSSGNVSPRPDVVNHSWDTGGSSPSGTDQNSIDSDEGVWDGQGYVRAAGNGGTGSFGRAAAAKNSLAIANARNWEVDNTWSTYSGTPGDNTAGDLSNSSSRGPTGDGRLGVGLTAPGSYNVSTDAFNLDGGYIINTGTSMASPHVAGILSTLVQRYPILSNKPRLQRAWLQATALKKSGGNAPDVNFGYGYANSYRAHWSDADWALNYFTGDPSVKSGGSGNWSIHTFSTDSSVTRLVIMLTWDEPPVTTTGGATPILADVELHLDWDNDQTGGQAGDLSSTGANNQQFIIVDNPPVGTHAMKIYPVDTRLNGLFAEDLHYSVVYVREKGDLRPDISLASVFADDTIRSSDIAILESTLTVSDYIGTNAMFNVLDNGGLTAVSKEVTLNDGTVLSYDATSPSWSTTSPTGFQSSFSLERMMLGAIKEGSRTISVGFDPPSEGTYSLQTKANIDNGAASFGDSDYEYPTLIVDDTAPAEVSSLNSSTHTVNVWTNSASADFSWSAATDALSGVDGYGLFTTSSPSRPGNVKDIEEVTSHSETLSEGSSLYFNISTVDNSGNWSSSHESYGPMKVDFTQPDAVTLLTSSSHAPGVPSSNPTVDLSWTTASDNLSGIDGYGIYMASGAGGPSNVKDIEEVTSYSETLADGTWYFNIRSVDNAGNWDSDFVSYGPIIIDLPPVYSVTPMTAGSPATFSVTGADPNSTVRLGYSLTGAGPFTTAFGVVDMTPPIKTLATLTSNGSGDASFTVTVPGSASGRTLYTQGLNNGVLTNSLAEFIN
ncbi:S8 family serine peptidase [Planctomycetota bacterium]|nr:S8 family serine peptidase [Planctomycetota bacterium]